ncbi:ArnT family glycosyltransferase [Oleiharenicola lentus]|uniref:ArnT family glycosyltransferase n=1 Tax=Oleiharenicola lentus TaxID=2508720 RepID=UPI003F6800F4
MKNSQELIHWLEQGRGARWMRIATVVFAGLLLSTIYSWKQFHGIPTESVMQQAVLGRQVAKGEGFTTLVNYPQTYAVMQKRGEAFSQDRLYPELHHAPLYALTMAGVFAVLPESLWSQRPTPPSGWGPDYAVLGLNLVLFWLAVWLAWRLGKKLFDERVAAIASVAMAVSVPLWEQTVMLTGLPLFMVLMLAVFNSLAGLEERLRDFPVPDKSTVWRVALLAVWCALSFLTEYSGGLVALVIGGYLALRVAGSARVTLLAVFAAVFFAAVSPWLVRNTLVVGHPLGLAWQNLALKAGDSTAEPAAQRNLATAEAPGLDVNKLGNKGLTGMEINLKERIWSGGGMMLTAFFIAGLAYQFRDGRVNRVRWCFAAVLLVLLAGQPFLNSGESLRLPAFYLAPLIILFGAGFFFVLVDSQQQLTLHWRWVAAGVLMLQTLPLVRDCLEPRRIHFHYPPYFPGLFMELSRDMQNRFRPEAGVATDVPAGTAWYGQMRVWSKPERLRDFTQIMVDQPMGALLLTPVTLDRPFFTELAARTGDNINLTDAGGWGGVYTGLVTRRMPANFALNRPPQKLTENMVLLVNPFLAR